MSLPNSHADWIQFAQHLSREMRDTKATGGRRELDALVEFVVSAKEITSDDLRDHIVSVICEMDGFESCYMDLISAVESAQSEKELLDKLPPETDVHLIGWSRWVNWLAGFWMRRR